MHYFSDIPHNEVFSVKSKSRKFKMAYLVNNPNNH